LSVIAKRIFPKRADNKTKTIMIAPSAGMADARSPRKLPNRDTTAVTAEPVTLLATSVV
jgi:hypothetical protein